MTDIVVSVKDVFTATVRGDLGVDIEVAKLPAEARRYVWEYGLQRVVNDACGKAGKRSDYASDQGYLDACKAAAEAKRDALYSGEITTRAKADSLRAVIYRLAQSAMEAKGLWPKDTKLQADALKAFAEKHDAKLRAKAAELLAATVELDLD